MLAVAVATMIPSDHAVPSCGDERRENIEGASKVRPTMNQKERWV
jgi:hypothetical protein